MERDSDRSTSLAVIHGPKDLRIEDRPLPPLSPTQVRVSMRSVTLCGSDLHYYNHFRNGDIIPREPLVPGHESSGIIAAVGSSVIDFRIGDRVTLEVGIPCGDKAECRQCAKLRYNICPRMRFRSSAMSYPHPAGVLAEEVVHEAKWCHKLPNALSYEDGALLEPMAVAVHAFKRTRVKSANNGPWSCLVLGAGAVGLCCAGTALAMGAEHVTIGDVSEERLHFALENRFASSICKIPLRQKATVEEDLEAARAVAAETVDSLRNSSKYSPNFWKKWEGYDVVFECTGAESCAQAAIYACDRGGQVVFVGMGTPVQTLPISAAALREVDLIGVLRYAEQDYKTAIVLMEKSVAKQSRSEMFPRFSRLITQRVQGIQNASKAFELAKATKATSVNGWGETVVVKVVVNLEK